MSTRKLQLAVTSLRRAEMQIQDVAREIRAQEPTLAVMLSDNGYDIDKACNAVWKIELAMRQAERDAKALAETQGV